MLRCSAECILQSRRSLLERFLPILPNTCAKKVFSVSSIACCILGVHGTRCMAYSGSGTCRYVSTFRCGFLSRTLPVTSVGTLLFSLCVRVQLSCYPSIPRCLEILRGRSLREFSRGFFQPVRMSDFLSPRIRELSLFPAFTFHFI